MSKVAIVVLADAEGHENLGRVTNALEATKEFHEAGDDVKLIFDGAGTTWLPELSKTDHDAHMLFREVRETVAGACGFCAKAFNVYHEVEDLGYEFLDEYEGHVSIKGLVDDGYQVMNF